MGHWAASVISPQHLPALRLPLLRVLSWWSLYVHFHDFTTHLNSNTHTSTSDMPPTMATAPPAYDGEQRQQKNETAKDFDVTISATLEISSYDLAVLKRHLLAQKWIPASADEDAIEDAVYRFRRTYRSERAFQIDYDYENIFKGNKRLTRLFEVWPSQEIGELEA